MASIIVTFVIITIIGIFVGVALSNYNDQAPLITKEDEDFVLTVMFIEDMGKDIMNGK